MNVEDVLTLRSVSEPRVSPDGRYVAYVVTAMDFERNDNDSNLWVVRADGTAAAVRLTRHPGADQAPRWAPDSSWIAFVSDRSGSRQLHGIGPDGGEPWQVTDASTAIESFAVSPDGRRIAFVAKQTADDDQRELEERRGRPVVWGKPYDDEWSRLFVAPLEGGRAGAARVASPDRQFVSAFVWGPESRRLVYAGRPSPELRRRADGRLYVASEPWGQAVELADLPGGETPVAWSADEGILFAASGHRLGTYNTRIWRVVPGEEPVSLTDALDENARFVALRGGASLVEASRRTGRGLYRVSESAELLSGDGYRSAFTATDDGSLVAFLSESSDRPAEVYVSSTERFDPRVLTSTNPEVESFAMGEQRVVEWRSRADGEAIEGVLHLPVGYRDGTKVPLLLVIHGGPSGVSSDRFSPRRGAYPIHVFQGMGYAVMEPNYRGSTGYGERFRGLNRGDISGRDWIDIDSGVDAMIERGIADPERLGIMGWSFGGHHTFWGITQTARFRAASAGAGANDLISMYSQTDLPEFYHTYLGPKPWEDFELYEERSAYRGVTNVSTPLLIQVGEKDERVPAEQSIQFYEAVRAIGKVETELVIYPGQPHGVREPRLVRDLLLRNVEWFQRHIPVEAAATELAPGGAAR